MVGIFCYINFVLIKYDKMISKEIKAIVYYIQGLQTLWKEGYNAEKVALYNYQFSLREGMDMPDGLLITCVFQLIFWLLLM